MENRTSTYLIRRRIRELFSLEHQAKNNQHPITREEFWRNGRKRGMRKLDRGTERAEKERSGCLEAIRRQVMALGSPRAPETNTSVSSSRGFGFSTLRPRFLPEAAAFVYRYVRLTKRPLDIYQPSPFEQSLFHFFSFSLFPSLSLSHFLVAILAFHTWYEIWSAFGSHTTTPIMLIITI